MSCVMRFVAYAKTKAQISCAVTAISCAVTAQLISAFVFATRIGQSLFFLHPKFGASSLLFCLYSLICVEHADTAQMMHGKWFADTFSHSTALAY